MSDTPTDPRRAELASRLLVAVLGGMFLLGLLGFVAAVFNAREDGATIPVAPELPAVPANTAAPATSAARPDSELPIVEQVVPIATASRFRVA